MTRSSEHSPVAHRLRRIEGRHNALAKDLRQAFAKAERDQEGDCAIEGLRIVEEAIRSGLRFRAVFFKDSAQNLAERLLPQIGSHVETILLPDSLFDASVPSETPQGVAALVRLKEFSIEDLMERLQVGPLIVLVGVQDPGNVGTILRSAEAFGSAGVVIGEGTVSPLNSKVIRASAGSIFRLPVILAKAQGGMEKISARMRKDNVRMIATSSHKGTALDAAGLTGPCAVLIGSEGSGLPRNLLAQVDELVAIPHATQVESLNAGVAGSIVLYEAARQRRETPIPA
jgi:TrmH family RNA methyltransferase